MEKITNYNYANIFFNGKNYFVTDSSNQCLFVTPSLRKAKNNLTKVLTYANQI